MKNLFQQFQDAVGRRPIQIGTVIAVDASGCTVELAGGARITARGSAAVNDRVQVRDGAIEGPAPDLPIVTGQI